MTNYRLTTVAACRVARIDRQRLNEMISQGDYRCAPETVPGRSRLFDEADLIALFVFARLVEDEVRPSRAGFLAFRILDGLRADPEANEITIFHAMNNGMVRNINKPDSTAGLHLSGMAALFTQTFNIETIRQIVRQGIDEERGVIGEED
ncbi:MAG: hypothetical protein WCO11_04325 [Sphingomonadales bacterium]|jgi:hypothetical protein